MPLPKPSPYVGRCAVPRCKGRGSFRCQKCGRQVCANHSGCKTVDYSATCGRCWLGKPPAT